MSLWEAQLIQAGHGMVLVSTQSDESAQHFYRKLGYRDCGYLLLDARGTSSRRSSSSQNRFQQRFHKCHRAYCKISLLQ